MKKYVILFMMLLTAAMTFAQGMSDQQVTQFIASEVKAGTSQAQIVTKLMQRGVNIDQIRRLRNQYDKQISSAGKTAAADGAAFVCQGRAAAQQQRRYHSSGSDHCQGGHDG